MKISHKFLTGSALCLAVSGYAGKSWYDAAHQPAYLQREAEIASLDKTLNNLEEERVSIRSQFIDCHNRKANDCEKLLIPYTAAVQEYNLLKEQRDDLVYENHFLVNPLFGFGGIGLAFLFIGLFERKDERQQ